MPAIVSVEKWDTKGFGCPSDLACGAAGAQASLDGPQTPLAQPNHTDAPFFQP